MRYTPTDITSTYAAIAALNANFDEIQTLIEKCLFTDGTAPNQMEAVLDMNHFAVENLAAPVNDNDAIRLIDLQNALPSLADVTLSATMGKVDSRANLSALSQHNNKFSVLLTESGREGIFIFNNSNLSAQVSADVNQGLYIAPASDTTGASGAWVRPFKGAINPAWFGLISGDVQANGTANSAAIASMLTLMAVINVYDVQFPSGIFWIASTIDYNVGPVRWSGAAGGGNSSTSSVKSIIKSPAGVTCFRAQGAQTSGANTKDSVAHNDARGTVIRDFTLQGSFTTTEAEAHGIQLRTMGCIQNCTIENFQGDGIHIAGALASGDGADPPYGNTNNCTIDNVTVLNNRNGILLNGSDANACNINGAVCFANRQWGVFDQSEFGCTANNLVLTSNGMTAANDGVTIGASLVSQGGNIYAVIAGQEVGAATNAPTGTATNNTWWYYMYAGAPSSGKPAWTNGMVIRSGGAVHDTSTVGQSVYMSCYAEGDQGKAQIVVPSMIVGGLLSTWTMTTSGLGGVTCPTLRAGLDATTTGGEIIVEPMFGVKSGVVTTELGGQNGNGSLYIMKMNHPTLGQHSIGYSSGLGNILFGRANGAATFFQLTTTATTSTFGTGAIVPDVFNPLKLAITDAAGSFSNGRMVYIDTAAPASGAHGQGEWQFDRSASTTIIGNKCTTAGSPGTWSPIFGLTAAPAAIATSGSATDLTTGTVPVARFGALTTAVGPLGFTTGAGGAVTQTTSRTTGVTLNKNCGAITLVSAAGSSTWSTFTVTNSSVAATDTVEVCQKSGANLYNVIVTAVAAGSFNLSVSAVSGTATESPVINFVVTKAVAA